MDRSINPVVKSNSKFVVRTHPRCMEMISGLLLAAMVLGFSGCCTPFGPGCDAGHCYDCDGTNRPIPLGPFQGLKQQLTCGGGGCGEVYIGEWISTPPDCTDPCCDDQFVGGAVPSQPFCWTLGGLFNPQRFSGRFAGGRSFVGCDDCGESGDSCGAGEYVDGGYVDQPSVEMAPSQPSGGCATCARSRVMGGDANTRQMIPAGQSTRYAQAPSSSRNGATMAASQNLNGNTTYATPPAARTAQRPSQPVPATGRPAPTTRAATGRPAPTNRAATGRPAPTNRAATGRPAPTTRAATGRPAPTTRPVTAGYSSSQSSSPDQVRQASAVYPESGSSNQSNYAPRTGASRNRVLN